MDFLVFRNTIINSLIKYDVDYTLFGGAVVNIFNNLRETSDLDLTIKADEESLLAFLAALEDVNYGTIEELLKQITDAFQAELDSPYSEFNGAEEFNMYTGGYALVSGNPEYDGLHIDLCFNIGEHNFDTMQSEEYIHDGIKINMVSLRYLIKMKANINKGYGGPRPQDIEDIKFLAEKLNLDPSTGQPKNKLSQMNKF